MMKFNNFRWTNNINGQSGELDFETFKKTVTKTVFKSNSLSGQRAEKPTPTLVITYDDSVLQDYTLAFPVHKKHNVPGEVCAIGDFVRTGINSFYPQENLLPLTVQQIKELIDNGWEISNHGKRHLCLGLTGLSLTANIGDTKLYVGLPHRWNNTFPYEIKIWKLGSTNYEIVNVIGKGNDSSGDYITIDIALKNQYITKQTLISLSDNELENELKGNIDYFKSLGVTVLHHTAPFSTSSHISKSFIRKHHLSARRGDNGINTIEDKPFRTFQLKILSEASAGDTTRIDQFLDNIVSSNGLGISMDHSWTSEFNPSTLEYLITQAKAKGIEITTRTKALRKFGNLLELGDFFGKEYIGQDGVDSHFIVTKSGELITNITNVVDFNNLT